MPAKSSESTPPSHAFEIKSGAVHLPILKLFSHDTDAVFAQLKEKVRQAPEFFRHAPMVVDLHEIAGADVDFPSLVRAMRACGLVPVGICGGNEQQLQAAREVDLSLLTLVKHDPSPAASVASKPAETGKIIDLPVRSGQRIYATGGDLVVLSQVSPGAEIMADGNIHVYGVLRGRALAGVQGNFDCRIFCHDLQAELVSIGGHYKVSENIDDSVRGKPVQIYLKDNALIIEKI